MTTVSACLFVMIFSGIIYFLGRSRQIIQQSEKKLQMITSTAQDAMIVMNPEGYISFWNESAEKLFGYSVREAIGQHLHNLIVPQRYHEAYEHGFSIFKTTGQGSAVGKTLELEALRRDGTEFPVELSLSATNFRGEWITVGIIRDITRRKQNEEEIRSMSITDQLTGLYNRRGFLTLAEQQLKIADRTKNEFLFLFADLDGLKWINDNLGHTKGDEAIVEAADVFREGFRDVDILARMGGDEFAVLTLDASMEKSDILKRRLQQQIDMHNSRENRDYNLSISIGIASRGPESSASIDDLMALADSLMYEQKKKKKASHV
jgi:diguanylate cyclase (GGDEF)-like protein/PAS domain S-box-containing protein